MDSTAISLFALIFAFLAVLVTIRINRSKRFRPQPTSDHANGDCFPIPVMRGDLKTFHARRSNP